MGAAFQSGAVPLSLAALEQAIAINGVAVNDNLAAFHFGRAACYDASLLPPAASASGAMQPPAYRSVAERVAYRRQYLVALSGRSAGAQVPITRPSNTRRRTARRARQRRLDARRGGKLFQALGREDEYEVARLFTEAPTAGAIDPSGPADVDFSAKIARQFEPAGNRIQATFYFAAPLFARSGANERPKKVTFRRWVMPLLHLLAKMKGLRGSVFDPFRFSADRRLERDLLARFEADFETIAARLKPENLDAAIALAQLPSTIKGFGPVKALAAHAALERRRRLMADFLVQGQQVVEREDAAAKVAA